MAAKAAKYKIRRVSEIKGNGKPFFFPRSICKSDGTVFIGYFVNFPSLGSST